MPITISHAKSVTISDATDTNLVRPSDWNSSHLVTYQAAGSEIVGAFSNGGNVSFGLDGGGFVTGSAPAGGGSNFVFSNANGVSFGTNGSTVTATVATNYLTTAMASDAGVQYTSVATYPNAGFVSAITVGSSSNTLNGAYLNMPQNTLVYQTSPNLKTCLLPAQSLTLSNTNANYILGDASNSNYVVTTDLEGIDYSRYFPYANVYRNNSRAHIQTAPLYAQNQDVLLYNRFQDTERYARESGLDVIAVDAALAITVNAGKVWAQFSEYDILPVTPATREFFWYHVAGVWTSTSSAGPLLNNTQYDDGTQLQNLAGGYTINYLYRGIENEDHLYIVLGAAQYDTTEAAMAVGLIANLPAEITSHAMLIGRVIVGFNAFGGYIYQSAFTESFSGATPVINHADLQGLTVGNDHPQYFLASATTKFAGAGYTSTTQAGSTVGVTQNSSGLSVAWPPFLTTYAAGGGGIAASIGSNSTSSGVTGYSNITSGTMLLLGGNNITLVQDGTRILISGPNAGGAQTGISGIAGSGASTATAGTVQFQNSYNITFGLNGNTITASASYAAQTVDTNKAGTGYTSTTQAGSTVGVTHNTSGLSAAWPPFITTYVAQTNQSAIKAFGVTNTGQTAGNTGVSSGIDWVLAGSNSITLSQSTAVGGPNTVWIQHPAWITTYVNDLTSGRAGTGYTSTTQAGSTVGMTQNTSGLSAAWPPFITTYVAQTNQSAIKAFGVTNTGQTAGNTGVSSGIDWVLAGSNSITLSQSTAVGGPNTVWIQHPAWITTYVNDLTSGRAGVGYTSTTQAGSTVGVTQNTSGLSAAWPPFITTYAAQTQQPMYFSLSNSNTSANTMTFGNLNGVSWSFSNGSVVGSVATNYAASDHSHGNPTLSLAGGLSGATASNSAGFTLSLTQAAAAPSPINFSAGTTTSAVSGLTFSNANGVTFGLNTGASAGVVTASVNAGGGGVAISAGTDSNFTNGTVSFGNAGLFSFLTSNGSVIGTFNDPDNWALYADPSGATSGTNASTIGTGGLYFKAGNNITLSGSSNSIVVSAMDVKWSLVGNTAGTNQSTLSANQFYFSGGPNITLSGNSNTIVVSAAAPGGAGPADSYWANIPVMAQSQTVGMNTNSSLLVPFFLPYDISFDRIRFIVTGSVPANTTVATSANATSASFTLQTGIYVGIYTNLGGGSSQSIRTVASTSGSQRYCMSISATASQWTLSQEYSYMVGGTTSQSSTATSVSTSNLSISTNPYSAWNGVRYLDMPFAASLPAGNYWIAIGSTSASTTAYSSGLVLPRPGQHSLYGMSQINLAAIGDMGLATNSSNALYRGLGSISAVAVGVQSDLNLGNVSTYSSHIIPNFQLMRIA